MVAMMVALKIIHSIIVLELNQMIKDHTCPHAAEIAVLKGEIELLRIAVKSMGEKCQREHEGETIAEMKERLTNCVEVVRWTKEEIMKMKRDQMDKDICGCSEKNKKKEPCDIAIQLGLLKQDFYSVYSSMPYTPGPLPEERPLYIPDDD
jgi:hypothetical protein